MDSLLQRVDMKKLTAKKIPFLIEVPVHGSSAPFLVSGTKNLIWVERASNNAIKAAVRKEKLPMKLSEQIVEEIARTGREREWANNFSFSKEGLEKAVEYLRFYGIEAIEVLLPEKSKPKLTAPKGVTLCPVPWVTKGRAAVVPADRAYLGLVGMIGNSHWTAVVHNPSRGMAVLGDW